MRLCLFNVCGQLVNTAHERGLHKKVARLARRELLSAYLVMDVNVSSYYYYCCYYCYYCHY